MPGGYRRTCSQWRQGGNETCGFVVAAMQSCLHDQMQWPSKRFYELTAAATAPPIAAPRVRALRRDVQLWHGRREGQLLVRRRSRAGADACGRERGLPLPGLPSNADRLGSAPHMIIHRLLRLALACAMFAATTLAARAANISILGKWEIVEAVPAPWAQPNNRSTLAAIGQRVLQTMVTFSPQAMDSKFKPFNCNRTCWRSMRCSRATCLSRIPASPQPGSVSAKATFPASTFAASRRRSRSTSAIRIRH
jgi:hypothetical protein